MKLKDVSKPPGPLVVIMPKLDSVPAEYRGRPYKVTKLLGDGDSNTKLAKSNGAGKPYKTFGLSLAPALTSGYQTCPHSTPACRAECLYYQGKSAWKNTHAARIARTIAYFKHRAWFVDRLRADVESAVRSCERLGMTPAVRLNVTSDFAWEGRTPELFSDFPRVRYYDYTKDPRRALAFARGMGPPNYDLTLSRSELNEQECLAALAEGVRVAIVFRDRPLPPAWWGRTVIDGDQHDLRFGDQADVIVGLTAKGTAKQDTSGFVVDADARRVHLPTLSHPLSPCDRPGGFVAAPFGSDNLSGQGRPLE